MDRQKGLAPIMMIVILVAIITGGILTWQHFGWSDKEVDMLQEEVGAPEDKCETIQHVADWSRKSERDICYEDLAKETNDESWCGKMSEEWMIDYCYEFFTEQRQDEAICEKMTKETNKNSCYREIAFTKDDETICEKISVETAEWPKTYCYIQIAERRNNDTVCEGLINEKERDTCYERFAHDQINKNSCEKTTYLETKDNCYTWFAFTQRDLSICEQIEDPLRQKDCKEHFIFDTSGWETYMNTKYGFEFKIPPLFIQTGYEIVEKDEEAQSSWLEGKCGVILFNLRPIEPYWGTIDKEEFHLMFPLWICPQAYCQTEEGGQSCQALREGRRELGEDELIWTFCNFVAENENFIVYKQGGPSSGDFADAAGWDKEEVRKIRYQMLSTFKFLE